MIAPMAGYSTTKKVVIIVIKNALLGVLSSAAVGEQWHDIFNFDNLPGVWAVFRLMGSVIAVSEFVTWAPFVLNWAKTHNRPEDVFPEPLLQAQQDVQVIKEQAAHAEAKIEQAKEEAIKPKDKP